MDGETMTVTLWVLLAVAAIAVVVGLAMDEKTY